MPDIEHNIIPIGRFGKRKNLPEFDTNAIVAYIYGIAAPVEWNLIP